MKAYTTPDGIELIADVAGSSDRPAVILLHGGGQTRHSWSGTMRQLEAKGYHVVNYDARGHGDSSWSPTGDYSMPALAADLQVIRATLGERVALVGASMGGMTSFYATALYGPSFATVVAMVDIALRPDPDGAERIKSFLTSHADGFVSLEEAADVVAAYKGTPRPSDISGLMKNLRARADGKLYWHWDPRLVTATPTSEPPNPTEELVAISGQVAAPLLLVRGGRSDMVTEEVIAEMMRLVPQTEICEVAGAGHMVAGDRNDGFNRCVLSFLERHMPCY